MRCGVRTMNLNQITIVVDDFEKAVSFYTRLGLRLIVSARGEYARFEMPDTSAGQTTLSLHLGPRPSDNGAVLYFEIDNVDDTFRRLSDAGIAFDGVPIDQPWLWREVRFTDPAGNRLCLYHAGRKSTLPALAATPSEGLNRAAYAYNVC